jgi:uncharacterized protein YcbX
VSAVQRVLVRTSAIPEILIGRVANLWRYPVKSLAAEALQTTAVDSGGFAGDRSMALIVTSPGNARTGKPFRGKEHHLLHTVATPDAAQALGAAAGVALQRVAGDHFFDAQPLSLIFDTWLHDVEELVGRSLDPLRYRPNIFACATADFADREAALVGASVDVGDVALRVVATIGRCVTTTYDIASGASDPAILREVAQRRKNIVGVYCTVERTGTIAPGDRIGYGFDRPSDRQGLSVRRAIS